MNILSTNFMQLFYYSEAYLELCQASKIKTLDKNAPS